MQQSLAYKHKVAVAAMWAQREACDKVFRIIAPELEAAGIDPLEVCT